MLHFVRKPPVSSGLPEACKQTHPWGSDHTVMRKTWRLRPVLLFTVLWACTIKEQSILDVL